MVKYTIVYYSIFCGTIVYSHLKKRRLRTLATKLFDKAKKNKADEFYTQLPDIEAEMRYYKE